ncbi:hypothetical protein CSC82_34795 [Rhodobacteraceae bacterium 4F10]|nr:hypothetical protein CSC82_34795 [Rhodobacteraceae bacterium 4F10]
MNNYFYELKKDFLNTWPRERLQKMTLEEYTNLDKDSFCYWVEQKTNDLGSIKGGSSFKFGVYKKGNNNKTEKTNNRDSDGEYAWHTKYGDTAQEAFETIRGYIIQIAGYAERNVLEYIQLIDLGNAYKWKIAFLYSNYNIINIFNHDALRSCAHSLGYSSEDTSYKELHKYILSKKGGLDFYDFSTELWKNIKGTVTASSEHQNIDQTPSITGHTYSTIDDDVPPKLDVDILSNHFADLLLNMQDNPGQMLGVFGQWGRGKTYFMNQVLNSLELKHNEEASSDKIKNQFYFLKFHAWKYQDTEGVWAYLYQQITELYLTHKNNEDLKSGNNFQRKIWHPITSKLNETKLLLKLNIEKNGVFKLIFFLALIVVTIIISFYNPSFFKNITLINSFLAGLLIVQSFMFFIDLWKLGDKGKRLIKKYTDKPNFNKLLGVQAEIQEELKHVLNVWMNIKHDEKKPKKRLLLFVDDIDRCKEDRLIQVIDALRVMLEDKEIMKRVIIVAAVDEDILERAIQWKYKNFIDSERKSSLIKEYMDKLFIACIKLPALYTKEKEQMIDNYAAKIGIEIIKDEKQVQTSVIEENQKTEKLENNIKDNQEKEELDSFENEKPNYVIKKEELKLLQQYAKDLEGNVTPRQLRIFMYRYL